MLYTPRYSFGERDRTVVVSGNERRVDFLRGRDTAKVDGTEVPKIDVRRLRYLRNASSHVLPRRYAEAALALRHEESCIVDNDTVSKRVSGDLTVHIRVKDHVGVKLYKTTTLDELFLRSVDGPCTFRRVPRLSRDWLRELDFSAFWSAVERVYSPSEELINLASTGDRTTIKSLKKHLHSAIKRRLRHDKDSQTFLFPINVNRNHWTLARAHYDKNERSIDIAYFDSYGGSVHSRTSEAHERVSVIHDSLADAIKATFDRQYWPDEMTTVRNIKIQKQDDDRNCGVFVCISMLRCIRGGTPNYKARNIVTEEDFVKVRCIIEEETDKTDRREKAILEDHDLTYIDPKHTGGHSDPIDLG
jgi:hypothetical protein